LACAGLDAAGLDAAGLDAAGLDAAGLDAAVWMALSVVLVLALVTACN